MSEHLTEKPTEVYVEIGYGTDPSSLSGNRVYEDGKVYIGVDAAEGDYARTEAGNYGELVRQKASELQQRAKTEKPSQNINFIIGDGRQPPLPTGSVKEVYMANVLTAPMRPNDKRALLAEISRTLEPNGELVIKVSWDVWMWPEEEREIEQLVRRAGLDVIGHVSATSHEEEFEILEEQYGTTQAADKPIGYYVIAQNKGHQAAE